MDGRVEGGGWRGTLRKKTFNPMCRIFFQFSVTVSAGLVLELECLNPGFELC